MKTKNLAVVLGCCLSAAASFCSSANAIVLANPGFESQTVESGGYLAETPTGWTAYSNVSSYGLLNPTPGSLVGKQGNNVAFLNVGTQPTFTRITQTVPYIILENDTIVLTFLIGTTNGNSLPSGEGPFPGFANYDAGLGSVGQDPWVANSQSSPAIVVGDMVTWTRTYTFLAGDSRIGQSFDIIAYASGSVAETGGQVVFDAFTVDVVPEPSVIGLVALGLVGVVFVSVRKREKAVA